MNSEEKGATAVLNQWLVKEGAQVACDEDLVEVVTDKVALTLPSPAAGLLTAIRRQQGETVSFGDLLAVITTKP